MANSNKRKGSAAELAVARWLAANGWPDAERRYDAGRHDDRGDIRGIPGVTLEVKNHQRLDLAGWLRELAAEMENDGTDIGAVVVKKRGTTDVGQWYAVLPMEVLIRILPED
jgi:hypothetical protein